MSYTQNRLEMFDQYATDLWELLNEIGDLEDETLSPKEYREKIRIIISRRFAYAKPEYLNNERFLRWYDRRQNAYSLFIESPSIGNGTSEKDVAPKISYK